MVSFGSPLASPAFQQMRAYLILARDLPDRGTGVESTHGSNLEITTVDGSGQIHFLAPFNVFVPLTSCLIFGAHSTPERRPVSHPRSSNRTCPIKASGFPTGFTADSRTRFHLDSAELHYSQFAEYRF